MALASADVLAFFSGLVEAVLPEAAAAALDDEPDGAAAAEAPSPASTAAAVAASTLASSAKKAASSEASIAAASWVEKLRLGEDLETVHCYRPRARVPSW